MHQLLKTRGRMMQFKLPINEFKMLPRVASYFLHRAIEISRTDYESSDTDILFAEGITLFNGPASVEFSFPKYRIAACYLPITMISSSTNPSLARLACAVKFKNLYKSLTGNNSEHKLYVSLVTASEPDTVDKALRYAC